MMAQSEFKVYDFPMQQFLNLPLVFPDGKAYMCGAGGKTVYFEAVPDLIACVKLVFFLADADRDEYMKSRNEQS